MMFETSNSEAMSDTPDLRTLSAADASPGWLVLDAARAQQFTGEIVFDVAPHPISVYFDHGVGYHAVRAGEPSLCEQLLEAGIIDASQIDRGVVRVGGVDHLGRLFDRDASVDRDAVTVFVELHTDRLLTELANGQAAPFRLTAYRHHASGVHRWFVAPAGPAPLVPVGHVAQIDDSITSKLPGLPSGDRRQWPDDVRIEWDQPDVTPLAPPTTSAALDAELDASAHGDEQDSGAASAGAGDPSGWSRPIVDNSLPLLELDEIVVAANGVANGEDDAAILFDEDFQILWPDGTEQDLPESIDEDQGEDVATDAVDETPGDETDGAGDADGADGADGGHGAADASPFERPPVAVEPAVDHSADAGDDVDAVDVAVTEAGVAAEHARSGVADHDPADPVPADPVPVDQGRAEDELADAGRHDDVVEHPSTDATPQVDVVATVEPGAAPMLGGHFWADVEASLEADEGYETVGARNDAPADAAGAGGDAEVAAPTASEFAFDLDDLELNLPDWSGPAGDEEASSPRSDMPALRFEMPPLTLADDATPTEQQPEDVIEAVRRALAAIEAATASATLPSIEGSDPVADSAPGTDLGAADGPATGSFAPPTADMSAEAVYARASRASDQPSGVASVVFVDDEPAEEEDERAGALRRLIGSLRRK